jgi:hypothetical protein
MNTALIGRALANGLVNTMNEFIRTHDKWTADRLRIQLREIQDAIAQVESIEPRKVAHDAKEIDQEAAGYYRGSEPEV